MRSIPTEKESIGFRRDPALPGIEILDAEHTARDFRWFHTAYGIAVPTTWRGEIMHRRRQQPVGPGMMFCTEPGELHTMPRVHGPGSFHAFMIAPAVFAAAIAECDGRGHRQHFQFAVGTMSPGFSTRLSRLLRSVGRAATAMEVQSYFIDLVSAIAVENLEGPVVVQRNSDPRAAERIRECIRYEDQLALDLGALGKKTGLSRFQVLRSFRRRYGLPPHSYQISVRMGIAREALKVGKAIADVAAELGFVDQSHFTRHFKSRIGVTPREYVRL